MTMRYKDVLLATRSDLRDALMAGDTDKAERIYQECEAEYQSHQPLSAPQADGGKGEAVARVNNEGFIVETGALPLMPGMQLYTAPQAECAPRDVIEAMARHLPRADADTAGAKPEKWSDKTIACSGCQLTWGDSHLLSDVRSGRVTINAAGASNERADAAPNPSEKQGAVKDQIIGDLQALFDSEFITENDSGDELVRLSGAIACVEDAFSAPLDKSAERADAEKDAALTAEWRLMNEAWNFGQFADDANWPLPLTVRAALRAILAANKEPQ